MIGLFQLKSSFLDDLFVNSLLIRFIFFSLFGAYVKHIESSHVFLVNKREINDNTDSIFCLNSKYNYLEKVVLKYLRIEKREFLTNA